MSPLLALVLLGISDPHTCTRACGPHGQCDEISGRCNCQIGWRGAFCDEESRPACYLRAPGSAAPLPLTVAIPCSGLRKISPMACECVAQCIRDGEEVCGPASVGCGDKWKRPAARRNAWAKSFAFNITTRDGFHKELTCVATPPGSQPHSYIPAPPGSRIMRVFDYLAGGYSAGAPPVPPSGLPVFGAGLDLSLIHI